MRRALGAALALALALSAALTRSAPPPGLEVAAARALAQRRLELTVATGFVPVEDRFLSHPRAGPLPAPRLLEAALARAARVLLPADAGDPALRGIDPGGLERLARAAASALAIASAAAAYLAARGLAGPAPALLAPAAFAFLPVLVEWERSGPAGAASLAAVLLFAHVALAAAILRAREPADRWLASLGLGLAAGLAALSSTGGVLVPALVWTCLALWSAGAPGLRAPAALTALVAAGVVVLGGGLPRGMDPWPEPAAWIDGISAAWWRAAVLPSCALLLLRWRARREIALLLVLAAGVALAAWHSTRFLPSLDLLGCLLLPAAAASAWEARRAAGEGGAVARVGPAAAVGLLSLALALPAFVPRPARTEPCPPSLHFLRAAVPPPGPWNHPDAPQEFAVLTLPSHGALVAWEGRRPVLAIARGAIGVPEREVALLFLGRDPAAFAAAARARGARYVVVRPGMERDARLLELLAAEHDPPPIEGSVLQALLRADPGDLAGLARVDAPGAGDWRVYRIPGPRRRSGGPGADGG